MASCCMIHAIQVKATRINQVIPQKHRKLSTRAEPTGPRLMAPMAPMASWPTWPPPWPPETRCQSLHSEADLRSYQGKVDNAAWISDLEMKHCKTQSIIQTKPNWPSPPRRSWHSTNPNDTSLMDTDLGRLAERDNVHVMFAAKNWEAKSPKNASSCRWNAWLTASSNFGHLNGGDLRIAVHPRRKLPRCRGWKEPAETGTDMPKPLEWQGANLLELSFTSKAELDIFDAWTLLINMCVMQCNAMECNVT